MRTQRELQVETEKLREEQFGLKMKLELVRKQNNDLKDQVEEAHLRIEELEPLEEENHELRDENQRLTLKLQNVTEDAVQLRDHNMAILKIQEESVTNMEKQNAALEEATEIIIRLEGEKSTFALEISQLKEQLSDCHATRTASSGSYHAAVDGGSSNRYPSRVYSVDESRPSTSHFDSDYYSQPASPQVKRSRDDLADAALSDRARNFLSMKKDGHKSIQDLKKRLSDASLKGARPAASISELPPIPEPFQRQPQQPTSRTPRRSKPLNHLSPVATTHAESGNNANGAPRTPTTGPGDGLRGMYREKLTLDTSTRDPQTSSSYSISPLATRSVKPSRSVDRPTPPARHSSKRAAPQSSREQLRDLAKEQLDSDPKTKTEEDASQWASIPPPPSVVSDVTTELGDPRERWWRDVNKLQHSSGKAATSGFAHTAARAGARPTPRSSSGAPYMETDFFFNGSESEEQFMKRAHSYSKKW